MDSLVTEETFKKPEKGGCTDENEEIKTYKHGNKFSIKEMQKKLVVVVVVFK